MGFTPPAGSVVVLVADVGWFGGGAAARGECRLTVDGNPVGDVALPGQTGNATDSTHQIGQGLNAVAGPLSGSPHTFALQCNEQQGDINFPGTWLSAIRVGS